MLFSPDDFCTLNLRIVRLFLLLFKTDGLNYLRKDFVFLVGFCEKQKVLLGDYNRDLSKWLFCNDIWHVTCVVLLLRPAPLLFQT